jgi:hypothetical protein
MQANALFSPQPPDVVAPPEPVLLPPEALETFAVPPEDDPPLAL